MNHIESGYPPSESSLVDSGSDSSVYRVKADAVKVYKNLAPEQLAAYQKLTSAASDIFKANPRIATFSFEEEVWGVDVRVNPIHGIRLSPPLMSVSDYIPGPSLIVMAGLRHHERSLLELEDESERETLLKLGSHFFEEYLISKKFLPSTFSEIITDKINLELGVSLPVIRDFNIKIRADADKRSLGLVVTDIGNYVGGIKFPKQ